MARRADAAVVAAAYTALVGLFPSQQAAVLEPSYTASLEALRERCRTGGRGNGRAHGCEKRIQDGVDWGTHVAHAILGLRANDGFSASYPAFVGGTAIGQWRPTPPAFGPMAAQGLAFTDMFVLANHTQFQPDRPRTLGSTVFTDDFNAVKALGRLTGSTRTDDETALARFWEGNASVHWNLAANQIAQDRHVSMARSARLLATLNIAMADTILTIWTAKRFYGSVATEVTWRPVTAIPLAEADGNPDTVPDPELAAAHDHAVAPGVPGGPSQSQWRGRHRPSAELQRSPEVHPDDGGPAEPNLCQHFARARRREPRTGLGRHALSEHGRHQRCHGRGNRRVRGSACHAAAGREVSVAGPGQTPKRI